MRGTCDPGSRSACGPLSEHHAQDTRWDCQLQLSAKWTTGSAGLTLGLQITIIFNMINCLVYKMAVVISQI